LFNLVSFGTGGDGRASRCAINPVNEQEQSPRVTRPWQFTLRGRMLLVLAVSLILAFVISTDGMWVACAPVAIVYAVAALLLHISPRTRPLSRVAIIIGLVSTFLVWRIILPEGEFSVMSAMGITSISLGVGIPFLVAKALMSGFSDHTGHG
jgi:hypothetical protein